ncbi:MAG: hypothetical protein Q7T33_04135 [Dehalococcoidia bacterium]|nr:hypothetical protein [Dehalococcoidia bacterium]
MSKRRLIAIEAGILAAGAVVLFLVVAWPFNSGATPAGPAARAGTPAPSAGPLLASVQTGTHPQERPSPAVQQPDGCGPALDGEFLAANQVLSYYGNPYTPDMGILGELEPAQLVERLQAHARTYDALNGVRGVQPALHLVYATAQEQPGRQGLYLLYVDDKTLNEYIDLACREGMLIFLDLQIGRSDVASEVRKVLPYLGRRHVHLALDPEFAMAEGEVPGQEIGSLDAEDVNAAQRLVQQLVEDNGLPDKIIIVHQFLHEMLTRPELIEDYPRIRLVVDMDGFGPAEIKQVKYGWFALPAEYAGIKLFFQQDPDLMSEDDVLKLTPDVIIYQ